MITLSKKPATAACAPKGGFMCLAVPMQIKTMDGFNSVCETKGIEREVSLFMMQNEDLSPGDHVLVHVGYAIQKVSDEQAAETWQLFDEMLATTD
jgi:hydrogenase expression/formation protein HypC